MNAIILTRQPEDIWTAVLDKIKEHMGVAVFNTWFNNLSFKEINGDTITISAPSRFIREWVLTNYYNKLKELASAEDPSIKRIDLKVVSQKVSYKPQSVSFSSSDSSVDSYSDAFSSMFDKRFTFENFVVDDTNKFAYAATKAIAEYGLSNTIVRSVLYITAPVGMGKTHLLQSIAQQMSLNSDQAKFAYMSAEKFMHQYIKAVKANELYQFKESLRALDVLLFDDIQFICGKAGTQQEFANTLNAMIEAGKIVVASSDRSPYDLDLDARTTSRLTGGLVVEIKKPSIDLRKKILASKIEKINAAIPDDVVDFIANSVSSSIRELEAALNKVVASSSLIGHSIDITFTKEVLKECLLAHETSISIDKIVEVVSDFYNISKADIISKSRSGKVVYPRQMVSFLAKQLTDKSLKEIGNLIGKRDHATVIYSIKKLEDRIAVDSVAAMEVSKLKSLLSN